MSIGIEQLYEQLDEAVRRIKEELSRPHDYRGMR